MVKLKNKNRLKWALKQYENRKARQKDISNLLDITPRRFRQLYRQYNKSKELPLIGIKLGRPKKSLPEEHKNIIVEKYSKYWLNALYFEKVIYAENRIRIPHNTVHKMLKEKGLAKEEPNKQKRIKPWIRYERRHSFG